MDISLQSLFSIDKVGRDPGQPYWIGLNDRNKEGTFVWLDDGYEVRQWLRQGNNVPFQCTG